MVALGSTSMIHLPFSGSDSESEPASDSEAFTSATNDFFEWTINSVMPGALMEVAPLPGIFLHLPIVLLCLWLGLVVMRFPIFSLSFVLWVRDSLSLLLL
jgi:hypothetical protein